MNISKEAPVSGDVHISSTGKGKKEKPKRRTDGEDNVGEKEFAVGTSIVKVDTALGLVFGFSIICKRDGEPYFDLQQDCITEAAMLDASTDFMLTSRLSKDMHYADDGSVVFAFPLTSDIAKALEIETKQTGLLIAMKPSPDVLAKFADGTYTGFSIGGRRIEDEEVE